jgi:hypothetical protein
MGQCSGTCCITGGDNERHGGESSHMTHINRSRKLQAARRGFRDGAPAERGGFAICATSALTLGFARLVTYLQERRRPAPRFRSLTRRAYDTPSGGVRVHHFVPGMLIGSAAGAAAIVTREDGRELWFSIPFGVGSGLVLDELGLLLGRDNPYWGSEGLVLIEGVTAALATAVLGARFLRRGAKLEKRDNPGG